MGRPILSVWTTGASPATAAHGGRQRFGGSILVRAVWWDERVRAAVVGGDFAKPDLSDGTSAWTPDGKTWAASEKPPRGYRSAVAWDADLNAWIAVGTTGSDVSWDGGRHWRPLDDASWNALSLPFAVGQDGKIGKIPWIPSKSEHFGALKRLVHETFRRRRDERWNCYAGGRHPQAARVYPGAGCGVAESRRQTSRTTMAEFVIRLADERGHVQEQIQSAATAEELRARFSQAGYFVYSVKPRGLTGTARKTKLETFLIFNQQFLTLIRAGMPILGSLEMLAKSQKNANFAGQLQNVAARVRTGEPISNAFEAQGAFPLMYTTTLLAGERAGNLEEVLGRYMSFQRVALAFRKKLTASLIYPMLLITLVICLFIFLVTLWCRSSPSSTTRLGRSCPRLRCSCWRWAPARSTT